jgi:hypothetical protein
MEEVDGSNPSRSTKISNTCGRRRVKFARGVQTPFNASAAMDSIAEQHRNALDLLQEETRRARYADRRIGTKRISTRLFNAAAILRNIAREWPS